MFFLSAAIYVFGAIVYLILAKGELQDWAREKHPEDVELQNKLKQDEKDEHEKDENDVMINGRALMDKSEEKI